MEKLFEVKTKYTLEEHIKFNYALVFSAKEILLILVISVSLLTFGIMDHKNYWIVAAILFPIFFALSVYFTAKRNYKSNKAAQDAEITIEFYENSIIQKMNAGSYTIEHDKIDKIIETKTHFYIMISKNQGVIVPKADMPDGLEEHIRTLVAHLGRS